MGKQEGAGATLAVCRGSIACPVAAVLEWLAAARITEGAVFRPVREGGHVYAAAAVVIVAAAGLNGAAMQDNEGFKVVDTIAGTSLKFIQAALPEFTRRRLNNLDGYRIIV